MRALAPFLMLMAGCRSAVPSADSTYFLAEHVAEAETGGESVSLADFRSLGWTLSDETRLSVVTPLGASLAFTLEVPEKAELRVAPALYPIGGARATEWAFLRNVSFQIHVESSSGKETVFDEVVRRRQAGTWIDRALDLGPWAGESVRLELATELPRRFLQDPGTLRAAREQFLALWGNPVLDSKGGSREGTNVVLISLDCVRADHLGVYGYAPARTAVLDAFAKDGVLFERAMTTAPSTLPSHMSMLTGLTPLLHGANKWRARDERSPYLPEVLTSLGFEVNAVVTGPYLSQTFRFESGFHTYKFMFDPRAGDAVDAAIAVLDRSSRRRQFLFLHLFDAHAPYSPPQAFLPDGVERPKPSRRMRRVLNEGAAPTAGERDELIALYDGEIAYVDMEVGRFLDELRARGLYDSSLIVVTADHGEAFHEHGHGQHSRTLYDEIVHIPLIVKWPFDSPRGVSDALASHIDILPTVLAEIDASDRAAGPGVDLARLASGGDVGERKVMSEFEWLLEQKTLMKIALREDEYKYIATLDSEPGAEMTLEHLREEELYALLDDPGETRNVLSENPAARDDFREFLANYLKTVHVSREAGEQIEVDEETQRRLESLGYVY